MLEPLLGNSIKEKILLSILVKKETYARDIASGFGIHLQSAQNQFEHFESGGVLISRAKGRTKLYLFNPRYPFLKELEALLQKALSFLPEDVREKYYTPRLRPRRSGKPL